MNTSTTEGAPRPRGMKDIANEVAHLYGMKPPELFGRNRDKMTARARHVAIYLCRKLPGPPSLKEIARVFTRDHTSVLTAIRRLEAERSVDRELDRQLASLEARLYEPVDAVFEMAVFYEPDEGAQDFTVHEMRARQGIGAMLRVGR